MAGDESFPRDRRLRRQADFDRVHRCETYAADDVLVVRASGNGRRPTRLGVSIPRKAGTAVVRNRWKRLVREAFRLEQGRLPTGLDLVVRPRRGAIPSAAAVRRSLVELTRRVARRIET
jgi:ribonuclease P protein component